jgi:exodeoxyribonuclease V alpha subunit
MISPRLSALLAAGAIAPIDAHFAQAMLLLVGEKDELVELATAFASRAVQRGHVCADLAALAREPLLDGDGNPVAAASFELAPCIVALEASALVGDGSTRTPLVLDAAHRLYLYRYFDYQRRLSQAIAAHLGSAPCDEVRLQAGLARAFPDAPEQKAAAALALRGRFTVISGGPGTGKTTTVVKILELLAEQATRRERVLLVAPTGKAAQRLREVITPELHERLHIEASTLHRALGYQPRTPTRFRHGRDHRLGADLVLADEASMIDLALMAKLVEAVPEGARLVLLGDKDQLASVEAGAVLADVWEAPSLAPYRGRLTKSYRFGDASGIAALARAIADGDAKKALAVLAGDTAMPYGEVSLHPSAIEAGTLSERFAFAVGQGFKDYLAASEPAARLALLSRFRVLCVHRRGSHGAEALNIAIERHLRRAGLLRSEDVYYDGRPLLVTANDHQLGLYNGDVGAVCVDRGVRRACFPSEAGGVREIPLGRLPAHQTVFAMTVHKSQGSEMDRVALVLPPARSPILTRELLYTAITRARASVDIFGSESVLAAGITKRIERASGLGAALEAALSTP